MAELTIKHSCGHWAKTRYSSGGTEPAATIKRLGARYECGSLHAESVCRDCLAQIQKAKRAP